MAQGSFTGQISDWVNQTKQRREAVHKGSTQRIIEIMQTPRNAGGNLRFDTGFLRGSLIATTSTALPPAIDKPDGVAAFSYDAQAISLVILGADIKAPITAVYTASYARPREYGSRGQPGDRWVALAAQRWQGVVNEECIKALSRAGG